MSDLAMPTAIKSNFIKMISILISISSFSYSGAVFSGTQVLPDTPGVTFQSDSNLYWLSFTKDADALWPTLKLFWEEQGIEIKKENPQLGFMETEWIKGIDGFRSFLLSDREPEVRERFRLRLERMPEHTGTRVYIYHTSYGILLDEEAVYTGYLPPSPELEIEMLSRLALFSGMKKEKVKQSISTYIVVKLNAKKVSDKHFQINMPGSLAFVSKKLTAALDRLNIDFKLDSKGIITAQSTKASDLNDKDIEQDRTEWEIDDSSDLEDEGFENAPETPLTQTYQIKLLDQSSEVMIDITNTSEADHNTVANFSKAIARNLNR